MTLLNMQNNLINLDSGMGNTVVSPSFEKKLGEIQNISKCVLEEKITQNEVYCELH